MTHRPQLDGLRAVAVAAVAWSHWERDWQYGFPFGVGVHLFYTLSGFLITGILLGLRDAPRPTSVLSAFYARRALRIMPAFYATLILAALAGVTVVRDSWPWHASYLSNVWIFAGGRWPADVSHFWSLAVEEQFYLVWPCLILFAPARWIGPAIVGAIATSPLFRWGLVSAGYRETLSALLVPGCLDSLGMGALLAWVAVAKPTHYRPLTRALLGIGLPGWLLLRGMNLLGVHVPAPMHAIEQTLQACVFAWIVAGAAVGFRGWAGWLLQSLPVTYLGRISYGVYLAHGFAGVMAGGLLSLFGFADVVVPEPFRLVLLTLVTIGAASVSWFAMERPLNAMKRFVPYQKTAVSNSEFRISKKAPTKAGRAGQVSGPAPLGMVSGGGSM
jgi:peptidoglycan/LPS O-acetylase OafA/YrhL